MNFIIPFTYDDGQKVVAKIRHEYIVTPPREAYKLNVVSNAATERALHDSGLPISYTWLPPNDSPLSEHILYFFEEWQEGTPRDLVMDPPRRQPSPDEPAMRNYLRAIARWYLELEKVTYDKVGSITYDTTGEIAIGPVISQRHLLHDQPYYLGPYDTARERYLGLIDCILDRIVQGCQYHPIHAVQGYLVYPQIRSYISGCKDMDLDHGPWYVKHGEEKGDHFMFNEEGDKVTSVLDWEWTYTTCKSEVFAAPLCFIEESKLIPSAQELALIEIYEKELGRPDLADCARRGRKYTYLYQFLNWDSQYLASVEILRMVFEREDLAPPTYVKNMPSWVGWKKESSLGDGDEKLIELIERETQWRSDNLSLAEYMDKEHARLCALKE